MWQKGFLGKIIENNNKKVWCVKSNKCGRGFTLKQMQQIQGGERPLPARVGLLHVID